MTHYRRRRKQKQYKKFIVGTGLILIIVTGYFLTRTIWKTYDSVKQQKQESLNVNMAQKDVMEAENDIEASGSEEAWNLMLTNKWNPIPDNYDVKLVRLPGGEKVDERIYKPLMEMLEDAKEVNCGELPTVNYGYRTNREQKKLYNDKVKEYQRQGYSEEQAAQEAEKWVAVPGTSEHQIGLAVDINGATYDLYTWLQENSYKYGFIFRYPGRKTEITGIAEEVWHYRYVGVEAATIMYEQDLCLEEYLQTENNR